MVSDEYLAGFLDGEGYIGILPMKTGATRITVGAEQVDRRPLEMLAARFGGTVNRTDRGNERYPNRSQVYYWHVYSRVAVGVLSALRDLLVVKQCEADLALMHDGLLRSGSRGRSKSLSWEERAERDALLDAMREWRAGKRSINSTAKHVGDQLKPAA